MAPTSPIRDEAIDLYQVLEVSPFATRSEIARAAKRKVDQLSNPDTDLSLSERARTHQLVGVAFKTLAGSFEGRVTYDIGRMMRRGDLALSQIPVPNPDYPSSVVAAFRYRSVHRTLGKTLDALVAAYDDAMDERFMQERMRGDVSDDLEEALDQMWVFVAHITLDMRMVWRGRRVIQHSGEGGWARGIRDPRVDGETGEPTVARRALKELRALEDKYRTRFWLQIARALAKTDPSADRAGYAARLLRILGHVRY